MDDIQKSNDTGTQDNGQASAEVKKVDETVMRETLYVAAGCIVLSALMQAVFLIIGKWDITVLLGNLLSLAASVGNFFLMGLTVQSALGKQGKASENLMRFSQIGRLFLIFLVLLLGVLVPCFNIWAVVIPIFFTRLVITFRSLFDGKKDK